MRAGLGNLAHYLQALQEQVLLITGACEEERRKVASPVGEERGGCKPASDGQAALAAAEALRKRAEVVLDKKISAKDGEEIRGPLSYGTGHPA